MVQRSHSENSLLPELIAAHLQNDRHTFKDEDSSYEWKQQLLFDNDSYRTDGSAQCEGSNVSHKNFGGVRVIPEKSDARTNHRTAKNCQLSDHRHSLQLEIVGKYDVAADVGENSERACSDDCASDGEPVQAVSQIDCVAGPDDDQDDETDEWQKRQQTEMRNAPKRVNRQIRTEAFYERHHEMRGIAALRLHENEYNRDRHARENLISKLGASGEAKAAAADNLDVIVGKSDGAEDDGGDHREPDKGIAEVGPEQSGQQDSDANQNAAHGGRAGFLLMILWSVFADVLANLKLTQFLDDEGPDEKCNQQRRKTGEGGAKRQIPEDSEWSEVGEKLLVEQPVKQTSSGNNAVLEPITDNRSTPGAI